MRKNRTKHEAKKPRLAKRALALCFALIFVCSCLLPAFAHSEGSVFPDSTVVEQQGEQQNEEPELLTEGNPTEGNEQEQPANSEQPKTEGTTDEQPKNEEPAASSEPGEQPKPEEPASSPENEPASSSESEPAASSSAPSEEPAASSSASSEEPASSASSGEAASASSSASSTVTSGDVINQGEAVYTYRFWTKEIDAFDLEQVDRAVKNGDSLTAAAKSVTGIAPCEVLKVANNAHLADYTVTEPTKDGYEFAGWYTLENGTAYEFSFDQNVSFEESKTIDVFAKWVSVAEKNAEKYRGWYENLVNTSDEYMLGELAAEYFADKDFYSYLGSLPENEQAELWEKLEPVNMPEVDEAELEDEAASLEDEGIALLSITAPEKKITVGKKLILTSNKKAQYSWGTYWQADHSWTTSNSTVAKVESGKLYQTEKAVVTGMAAGTATITHTVKCGISIETEIKCMMARVGTPTMLRWSQRPLAMTIGPRYSFRKRLPVTRQVIARVSGHRMVVQSAGSAK